MRTTPDTIQMINKGEIFVFGSNLGGRHGKGAARTAMRFGARWGQASGLQGNTYGIPTKDASIRRVLSLPEIKRFVDKFIKFAKENKQFLFLVTEIGCGLAGYKPKDIAPLFVKAIDVQNVFLPRRFWRCLKKEIIDE